MTANVLEHRRARAFADAVEDRPSTAVPHQGGPEENPAGQFADLLATVSALGALPAPEFDPEVRMVQRAQVMAEFERHFAGGGAVVPAPRGRGSHRAGAAVGRLRPRTRWGRRLAVSGLAAGVAVTAFGGMAAASSSAIPGDPLYGMKRSLENWQLDFAGSNAERGRLLLDQASQRMSEAQQLIDHDQADGHRLSPHVIAEVTKALSDMNAEGTQGSDLLQAIYRQNHSLAPLQSLAAFDRLQQRSLDALAPQLPRQAEPVEGQLQQLLSGISAELAPLHLTPGADGVGGGASALPGGDTSPSTGGASAGSTEGSTPRGATTSGTGAMSSPGTSPSSNGGELVGGLTGGLLGSSPSTTPSATDKAGSASPSAAAPDNGVTVPPLIPGLLPSLGIGLADGN
jgi:hypothetical protein